MSRKRGAKTMKYVVRWNRIYTCQTEVEAESEDKAIAVALDDPNDEIHQNASCQFVETEHYEADETNNEFICGACARSDHDEVPVHSAECDKCELCVGCCPHPDEKRDSQCGNCDSIWTCDELNKTKDLNQRLTPGDLVPSGECPDCGALCYLLSEIDEDALTADQVYESLEAAIDCENEDVQRSITREYKKQIRMRCEADKGPAVSENLFDPLTLPSEYLFTMDQKAQLTAFAKGIIEGMMEFRYGDSAASVDHWFQLGTIGDVHLCDDEEEQTIQAWACRLKFNTEGQVTGTDASRSVRLDLGANSRFGAKQRPEDKKG